MTIHIRNVSCVFKRAKNLHRYKGEIMSNWTLCAWQITKTTRRDSVESKFSHKRGCRLNKVEDFNTCFRHQMREEERWIWIKQIYRKHAILYSTTVHSLLWNCTVNLLTLDILSGEEESRYISTISDIFTEMEPQLQSS